MFPACLCFDRDCTDLKSVYLLFGGGGRGELEGSRWQVSVHGVRPNTCIDISHFINLCKNFDKLLTFSLDTAVRNLNR